MLFLKLLVILLYVTIEVVKWNNLIEQDYRYIKRHFRNFHSFKKSSHAAHALEGIENIQ